MNGEYQHWLQPMVRATSELFLPTRATFRSNLASESYWLQPVLVITVRWWSAPVSVGGLSLAKPTLKLALAGRNGSPVLAPVSVGWLPIKLSRL